MLKEKFIGCLVGLAVGDALGMPGEGLSERALRQKFGKIEGFLASPERGLKAGQVTDDTQLTLAIAKSIVEAGEFSPETAVKYFIAWLDNNPVGAGLGCLSACQKLKAGVPWVEAASGSAGCGGAMRVAPIGLFYYDRPGELVNKAEISARITHGDPSAIAGAVVVAKAVAIAVTAKEIKKEELLSELALLAGSYSREMAKAIENVKTARTLHAIGNSPKAIHTVPAALFCFVQTPGNFTASVLRAANAGGDSDSIAAITGAISGTFKGYSAIPLHWCERVEKARELKQLALKLYQLKEGKNEQSGD